MNTKGNVLGPKALDNLKSAALHSYRFDRRLEQHVYVWECKVHNGSIGALAFGQFLSVSNGGRIGNTKQSVLEVISVDSFVVRCKSAEGNSPYLCGSGAKECRQFVPKDFVWDDVTLEADHEYWERRIEYVDEVHDEAIWLHYDGTKSKVIREWAREPETRLPILVKSEIISPSEVPNSCVEGEGLVTSPTVVAGTSVTYKQIDCYKALKITQTLCGWNTFGEEVYENMQFNFPGLYLGETMLAVTIEPQERTYFKVHPKIRTNFTKIVSARHTVSLHSPSASYAPSSLWQPIVDNMTYNGFLYNINVQGVLHDQVQFVATTNSNDTYWGPSVVDQSQVMTATNISRTQYLAAVTAGAYKDVGETYKPWKFNLYRKETVSVIPE